MGGSYEKVRKSGSLRQTSKLTNLILVYTDSKSDVLTERGDIAEE